jgi:threonyl-tRNA synthetase
VQVVIIPISDKFNEYAKSVYNKLKEHNIRVKMDTRSEKMGAKIRIAEINKIPIMIILGEQEEKNSTISVRRKFSGDLGSINLNDFMESALNEITLRLPVVLK